jgi:hypothetical protein
MPTVTAFSHGTGRRRGGETSMGCPAGKAVPMGDDVGLNLEDEYDRDEP